MCQCQSLTSVRTPRMLPPPALIFIPAAASAEPSTRSAAAQRRAAAPRGLVFGRGTIVPPFWACRWAARRAPAAPGRAPPVGLAVALVPPWSFAELGSVWPKEALLTFSSGHSSCAFVPRRFLQGLLKILLQKGLPWGKKEKAAARTCGTRGQSAMRSIDW